MNQNKKEQGIESPYAPKRSAKKITKEELATIKKMLGVECIFIVADTEQHLCTPETCTGHAYTTVVDGFTDQQFAGIIMSYAQEIMGEDFVDEQET